MQQYVDRVDEFLEAMISREAMPGGAGPCRICKINLAVWRCRDCTAASPVCRRCMRVRHRDNPFHRLERWNGSFFRPAEMKEVGAYLLVPHHTGEPICDTLSRCCNMLDTAESKNDNNEQEKLRRQVPDPDPEPAPMEDPYLDKNTYYDEGGDEDLADDDLADDDLADDDFDDYDEVEYSHIGNSGAAEDPAIVSVTIGSLHRVVHINGVHHIEMVSCQCHGDDVLPLDLFAAQLLPASLKRIKTLFTAQVLDMFRLSNLELKASAYQFYQMLKRLTRPMAPPEVVDLYREFRRMSRIWRWMKRLKWAGYAGSKKKVEDVKPGELAIFCPACPQPGINIPDNWREDSARQVCLINS
jgi:hypothetical protein